MKRALFALLLLAAPLDPAAAQSKTFSGCTTFSCHTATFTISEATPVSAYGRIWTQQLTMTWTHYFSAVGGFFHLGPALLFPSPNANSFHYNRWWGDTETSIHCFFSRCVGLFTESVTSYADEGFEVNWAGITAYRGAPLFGGFVSGPPETVTLAFVPEPTTWTLLAFGLVVIGTATRVRRRALR